MTRAELHQLGCRLRTQGSTRGDWLTYIDGTLPLLAAGAVAPKAGPPRLECAVCAERREKKTRSQRKWRQREARA